MEMYMYIDEHNILKYDGEPLKRYVGDKLVKIILNATEQDLLEFGYKHLVVEEPLPDKEGFYTEDYYEDGEVITQKQRYIEIKEEMN